MIDAERMARDSGYDYNEALKAFQALNGLEEKGYVLACEDPQTGEIVIGLTPKGQKYWNVTKSRGNN